MKRNPDLLTGTVTIRGKEYEVCEIDSATMSRTMELMEKERWKVSPFLALQCCISPGFKNENEVAMTPHYIVDKIADKVWSVTKSSGEFDRQEEGDSPKP